MRLNRTVMRRLKEQIAELRDYCELLEERGDQTEVSNQSDHARIKHMIERTQENLEGQIQWAKDDLRSKIDQTDREVESVRRSIPSSSSYGSRW